MDKVIEIIQVLVADWQTLITAILTVVGGASAIVKVAEKVADITPWDWDNAILNFVGKVLAAISLKLKK